ncbi:MAG TPA: hypothetical protein VF530_19830 [Planctomycetota bacterium]
MYVATGLVMLASVLSLPPQAPLAEFPGHGPGTANLGDLDGDGVEDFLAGTPFAGGPFHAVSGRTLKTLFLNPLGVWGTPAADFVHAVGDFDGDGFGDVLVPPNVLSGASLLSVDPSRYDPPVVLLGFYSPYASTIEGGYAVLGDLDGDGRSEIAVGSPNAYVFRCPSDHPGFVTGDNGGAAITHSSLDGSIRSVHFGTSVGDSLGGVVARLGDLDGDGLADLGAATRQPPVSDTLFCSFSGGGYTRALSSGTGALLWEVSVAPRALCAIDDVDEDGTDDVALGFPYHGKIELRSGRTGALLLTIDDDAFLGPGTHLFGNQVLAWPDADGDGLGDLVASAPQPLVFSFGFPSSAGPGQVVVLSSRSGKVVSQLHGKASGQEFGVQIARLGDLTGDGTPELAVGSTARSDGLVQVFSPRTLVQGRGRRR